MIPTPYSIGRRRRTDDGALDSHGNPVAHYGPTVTLPVHSISGPDKDTTAPARDGRSVELVVMAPAGTDFTTTDLAVIDGGEFDVAEVIDWTKGPWPNPVAGIEIHLTRSEG